jgi:rsbT co-antagonist protein RsbR
MDVDDSQPRMAAFMRDHQDKVVGRWSELVAAGVRGRSSAGEVRHELEDIYSLVLATMSGADDTARTELRAALAELSRSRARSGFTPSETALGVFSLKEAVYELISDAADLVPEFIAFSRLIDDLGLFTFETYGGPGADPRRPGREHARAVDAGGPAVGRHHRGAAGRHA